EGMRVFHTSEQIHRDIKCDNILLHSPPRSGRVYVKITDFGFAKKEGQTQKVDIYALGITFYALILHIYPVFVGNYEAQ
ncbi:MAG: hypothetical protein EZS28_007910, partial [Streblomastix strix]